MHFYSVRDVERVLRLSRSTVQSLIDGGFVKPTNVHRWVLFCLDFDTGKVLWQREAHKGKPPQPRHPRNSYASETPICDGELVYAYFANIGLFCYDMEGKPLWEKRWDSYPMRGGWGIRCQRWYGAPR